MAFASLSEQLARTSNLLFRQEKEQNHPSKSQNCKERESQSGQESLLDEKEEGQSESMGKKSNLRTETRPVSRWRGRASKESPHGTRTRKHERMSKSKYSPKGRRESWFHSKSGHI